MSPRRSMFTLLFVLMVGLAPAAVAAPGFLVDIDGPIGPAQAMHLEKSLQRAQTANAALVILRIDTPGGLDTSMRDMIKAILASPVPVVGFVAPEGARAASAGTFLLYACHVAAMAPATNLGAATPIPLGGGLPRPGPRPAGEADSQDEDTAPESAPADPADAAGRKAVNDAVAYIRALAEKYGRNADWAEQAVRSGASLSSSEALAQNVIDLIAPDVNHLLAALDGRPLEVAGRKQTLSTADVRLQTLEKDWRIEFLSIITNPTVAYMLLLAGLYGLLLEGYNPGAILPGVVGAISLLLALFALQVLPVNYAGLGLILLGVILMIAEALVPSFGVLGFGGVAAFVIGSVILMDADVPGYEINLMLVAAIATAAALLMLLSVYLLMRSRRSVVVTGEDAMLGASVQVLDYAQGAGWGLVAGEQWKITGPAELIPGQTVRVQAVDGLTLVVEPMETRT